MTFRSRLLVAFAVISLLPLGLFAAGVRRELGEHVTAQHASRVAALARVIERDLRREEAAIAAKLKGLTASMEDDDRLRLALVHGASAERRYLLDYASRAMRLTGLDALQLHDERGRILSSGHFRNDFDRLAPRVPDALSRNSGRAALATLRAPDGPFLAMLRVDTLMLGQRQFRLVGGVKADSALLARFSSDASLRVTLALPYDSVLPASTGATPTAELSVPIILPGVEPLEPALAHIRIFHTGDELGAIRRSVDRWLALAIALIAMLALALGAWLSARLSQPLSDLADATSRISLEGPEVDLATGRDDEIGIVARRLTTMARRLRTGAAKLREAERRATVGDMARQVNHDIKNGLVPIRNVLRHLTQVQEQEPERLAGIFAERRQTLDSSVGYLDTLARRYAMLTPRMDQRPFDLESVAADVARSASLGGAQVELQLTEQPLPRVHGDPIVLRRILENLCRNALESLANAEGKVTLRAAPVGDGVRISVIDTGRGMSEAELARAFDDFYTTKAGGTGLGLSVVRRLTNDLGGSMRIESAPGAGTRVSIDLPASGAQSRARAPDPPSRFPIPESRFPKS